jgi:hypothetical protein
MVPRNIQYDFEYFIFFFEILTRNFRRQSQSIKISAARLDQLQIVLNKKRNFLNEMFKLIETSQNEKHLMKLYLANY